jgi:hypothetical protein
MSDWIGLAVILLLVVVGIIASAYLGTPRKRISEEEFQRRVREGQRSQAAVFALQQLMQPKAAEAVAVQQDLRHGYYNKKRIPGEGDDDDDELAPAESRAVEAQPVETDDINSEQTEERDA